MWTKEQQRVIDERDCSILVSAAAGSGKTAVLVERILKKVLDEQNPCDIDQFLVVTFTNAAAAQMRDKIAKRLEVALEEKPYSEHLMKQLLLVNRADITTIDSFCLKVVREHFSLLNLDSAFNIGDPGMMDLLKADVLTELFDRKYDEKDKKFIALLDVFSSGYDDAELKKQILTIYNMVSSYPIPEKWIESAKASLCVDTYEELLSSDWMKGYMRLVRTKAGEALSLVKHGRQICESPYGPDKNISVALSDEEFIEKIYKADSYGELYEVMKTPWKRLATCRGEAYDEELVNEFKNIRASYKDIIAGINAKQAPENILQDIAGIREYIIPLLELVQEFIDLYSGKKNERKTLEFSDVEHMAYKLVCAGYDECGMAVPSEVGKDISKRYLEIYIDEYQDSNYIQEDILCSVSGIFENRYNMFMVGDVKQSIYRFRMARPDLFIDKYKRFKDSGNEVKIELKNNFRSRDVVLMPVNYFFYQIMGENLGGIEYNESVALVPTREFPEAEDKNISQNAELMIINGAKDEPLIQEAEMIAARIKELVDKDTGIDIYDDDKECYRKAEYRDIVILARSIKALGEPLYNTLTANGIPVYLDDPKGYFNAVEVRTILSLLSVVDNSRQDIPFAAVLLSPMGNMTENELAIVCKYAEKKALNVELLCDKCECYVLDHDDDIAHKLTVILDIIETLKHDKTDMSIASLIWKALSVTGYYTYAMAMPMGERRKANIDMLLEKAASYENGYYKGLFNFLRYIDKLKINAVDFGEAHMLCADENMVNIISMHKSKGLEYPIVFVSGLGKQFNQSDNKKNLLINSDYYLASMVMERKGRYKKNSLLRDFFRMNTKMESMAEEERVLYVAMTRAKEKLIMTGYTSDIEKLKDKYISICEHDETLLPYSIRQDASGFMNLLVAGMMRYDKLIKRFDMGDIINVKIIPAEDIADRVIDHAVRKGYTVSELKARACLAESDDIYEKIKKDLNYKYPYERYTSIRSKMSISDIKKMKAYDGKGYDMDTEFAKPSTERRENSGSSLTGAERGTIVHKFMELFPFDKLQETDDTSKFIEEFKQKLNQDNIMDERELSAINTSKIEKLLTSGLGIRMISAAKRGELYKEKQFSVGIPVHELYAEGEDILPADDIVIVQGIVDAYFYEDDNIILIDYKTDRADEETLIGRYKAQLVYYAETLEKLLARPVTERLLYSFSLDKEVPLKNS